MRDELALVVASGGITPAMALQALHRFVDSQDGRAGRRHLPVIEVTRITPLAWWKEPTFIGTNYPKKRR